MFAAAIPQTSLTDPPPASAVGAAADWVSALLLGPLATSVAVIAVAWVGFAMLQGRCDVRRGLMVVLGCFLLFGAKSIAEGLRSPASNTRQIAVELVPPQPVFESPSKAPANGNPYDPYAGATVPAE
jgi:type IV secretion system protein VirB2